jgi:hypothetical protein
MKLFLSKVDYLIAAVFVLFGVMQFNDPDGWIWAMAYFAVVILTLFRNVLPKYMIEIATALYILAFLSYIPNLMDWYKEGMPSITGSMKAESPFIEYVREAGGLLIVILALLFYIKKGRS